MQINLCSGSQLSMSQAPEDTNTFSNAFSSTIYYQKSEIVNKDSVTYITIGGKPVI